MPRLCLRTTPARLCAHLLGIILLLAGFAPRVALADGAITRAHDTADFAFRMGVLGPPAFTLGLIGLGAGLGPSDEGGNGVLAAAGFLGAGVGATGILVGPPLQAAKVNKAARLATAQGAQVDNTKAKWAWGLWAGSLLVGGVPSAASKNPSQAATIGASIAGVGLYAGSLTMGRLQIRDTERALARSAPAATPASRFQWALQPTPNGLSVAGTF